MGGIFIHCIGATHYVVLYRGVVKSFAGQNLKGKTQNLIGIAKSGWTLKYLLKTSSEMFLPEISDCQLIGVFIEWWKFESVTRQYFAGNY